MTDTPSPQHAPTGAIPQTAFWAGLAGWIPFWIPVLLAAQALATGRSAAAEQAVFTIYAAIILSFLGGARWGRALAPGEQPAMWHWLAAVAPGVLGLGAVIVHWAIGAVPAFAAVAAGLAVQYLWDRNAVERRRLPRWYGRLRTLLTAGAIAACLAMAVLAVFAA